MQLFFRKFTVYLICFSVVMLPYRQAHAWWWGAAVVIDVVTEAWPDGDHIKTGGICGKRRFGANDPIWKCETRTPKSTWLGKAKKSGKWGLCLLLLVILFLQVVRFPIHQLLINAPMASIQMIIMLVTQ
ncbi:TPA: hypothetical protein ACPVXK_003116 [Vibrio parahaemolyticus]